MMEFSKGVGVLVQELGKKKGHVDITPIGFVVGIGMICIPLGTGNGSDGNTWVLGVPRGFLAAGFARTVADGEIAERAAFGPVAPTRFTEVPGLGQAVVVEVTEFSVGGDTAGAVGSHLYVWFPP